MNEHAAVAGAATVAPHISSKRILMSLEMATLGTSGIPNEARILVSALAQSGRHALTGLIMEATGQFTSRTIPNSPGTLTALEAANYLVGLSGHETPLGYGLLPNWRRILWRFHRVYLQAADGYHMRTLPIEHRFDTLWRRLFANTLDDAAREALSKIDYKVSQMTLSDVHFARRMPFAPQIHLRTDGYDAAVFHDCRPIRLSQGTARVIRYHDAIPVTHPDLVSDGTQPMAHYQFLKAAARDSWFVCNSEATRRELISVAPQAEPHAIAIPCAQNYALSFKPQAIDVPEVIRRRASGFQVRSIAAKADLEKLNAILKEMVRAPNFMIAVAAIEPKKNVSGLVRAFERYLAENSRPARLVLVGRPSWNYDRDLRMMEPHIRSGALIHLEDVPNDELMALFAAAKLCVFPSHTEGFGYPPIEALYAGTPSLVADIPALRETCGPAAVYAPPTDARALGDAMSALMHPRTGEELRASLAARRQEVLARYEPDVVSAQWNAFLAEVKPIR